MLLRYRIHKQPFGGRYDNESRGPLRLERDGLVALLTIDRPQRRAGELDRDASVRVVFLKGCVGAVTPVVAAVPGVCVEGGSS